MSSKPQRQGDNLMTSRWIIDRHIPIALLVGLAMQTIGAIWWAASTTARLDQLENQAKATAPMAERVIRLEEKIGTVQAGITEIKSLVQNLIGPMERPRK